MCKILIITEIMDKGVGKHILDLYENLSIDKKIDIYIAYGTMRKNDDYLKMINKDRLIEVKNLQRRIGLCDIKSYYEIKKIIKNIKPDIVHCHSSKAGLSGRIAAKKVGVGKVLYSPHAYFFLKYEKNSFKRKIFILAERFLSKKYTNYTITTSRGEERAFIENKIDKAEKEVLIEHGIIKEEIRQDEIDSEREKYNIKKSDILIGAMARFENQKDPIGTFKIMDGIARTNENVKCIFFGNGSKYEEVKQLNKDNMVILPGETKNAELSLAIMNIYLTASLYEGLPYAMVQALSQEKPIIASRVEGNEDCVEDGINGYLFESQNYAEAIKKIDMAINNNELLKMGNYSKKIFNERFTLNNMIEKYKKIYLGENDE